MLATLKKLLGFGPGTDFRALMAQGAQIIDVRTKQEYEYGHIHGSKNIPLQTLKSNLKKINKSKPVITCCASGARSASAKTILQSQGFEDVYNGGGWLDLNGKLK